MVMAVSSNEKEIANTMLKSVVHMAAPHAGWHKPAQLNAQNRDRFH